MLNKFSQYHYRNIYHYTNYRLYQCCLNSRKCVGRKRIVENWGQNRTCMMNDRVNRFGVHRCHINFLEDKQCKHQLKGKRMSHYIVGKSKFLLITCNTGSLGYMVNTLVENHCHMFLFSMRYRSSKRVYSSVECYCRKHTN